MTEKPYHTVEKEDDGWGSSYETLVGPDEFQCTVTEPEDRTWGRDLSPVIERLNEQHARIAAITTENARLREALEACAAWHYAESNNVGSFQEKMELCKYSEWATQKALGLSSGVQYEGVPRMFIWPEVHIHKGDEVAALQLIEMVKQHAALTPADGGSAVQSIVSKETNV